MNREALFPDRKGVGYGLSSFNVRIVTFDPYRYSISRLIIYAAIWIGMSISVFFMSSLRERCLASTMTVRRRQILCSLVWFTGLSIVASGVHHFDNFIRIEKYYLSDWIYNGHFFILDIGIANWLIASFYGTKGIYELVYYSLKTPFEQHTNQRVWATRWMFVHCVMIWSGQLHYSLEHILNFSWDANISILTEGTCAVILNIYILWHYSFLVLGEDDDASQSHEYSQLPLSDTSEDVELTGQPTGRIRRRSKDGPSH